MGKKYLRFLGLYYNGSNVDSNETIFDNMHNDLVTVKNNYENYLWNLYNSKSNN